MSINYSLQNEVIRVNLENESLKDKIIDLKKVIEKWTYSKVTLDQLLSEQVPRNIVKDLGGKGRRKEKIFTKEVVFTKADESLSKLAPKITCDSESECDSQEPLPPLPKLIGAAPSSNSESLISLSDLTFNMAELTLDTPDPKKTIPSVKVSPTYVKGLKRQIEIFSGTHPSSTQLNSSSKQNTWFGPSKHCRFRNHLSNDCYSKTKCSTCGSTDHQTKEYLELVVVNKTLSKLKAQSPLKPSPKKTPMILKPFIDCKYYGFNDHHSDHCKFYPGCEVCGSIAHEACDCLKKHLKSRRPRIANRQSEPTEKYSKQSGPKVVFGDDSLGDTEGYGSVNCNGITFTRVAYVNGLKHNLINISQLCDAIYKVLFTKTQGTIYNQNDEVVLIAPRRRDVYVIDMSYFNIESNAFFFAKASPSVNWLWHKRLSHLNFKNINNLAKHNLIENLNEVSVKKLRSDNGTEFKNHKMEEFCDEKGISQNFSSPYTPEQNGVAERRNRTLIEAAETMLNSAKLSKQFWGEAVNIAFYTQNRSIIVKRHGKTSYDLFRGRSSNISYFHVFGCPVHIHNHRDHLGKFDEKANDGFFLDDEAISQSSIEGDTINFNENRSFHDDEFLEPRSEVTQCPGNTEYFPYIPAYENTTPSESPILQESIISEDPPKFTEANNYPALNEPDQTELADLLEHAKPQNNHIELVNIIGEPLAGITTRSRIRDSDAASASECLYVNFLSEMEPKKLIEALEEEGWIIAM
ncbi:retrovirus-related pol polyprotein from transposon TNT 1-94 [Tanacetum coccineum]|uniref:Retrovirus-related pol polyprotein from transposon TNT 1-94 n=1 Tax=Tanacetum coccineum TaxID=301880 RepID=A0ABQ4ZVU9_9ASTR